MKAFRIFAEFVREQGVVGLAVGFVLGGSVSKLVTAFVRDFVDPIAGLMFGAKDRLATQAIAINGTAIAWGDFAVALIDFLILLAFIFLLVRVFRLERLDRRKG